MKTNQQHNEQGIVSLMVTIILMLVISLIVISFARTSRREQRDSLDRQLSTNAFYAAESGVNAARKAIGADPSLLNAQYISSCTNAGSFANAVAASPSAKTIIPSVPSANIGSGQSNATYTCLFVDPTVPSIERSPNTEPYSVTLKDASGAPLGAAGISVSWDAGTGTTFRGCPVINIPTSYPNPTMTTNCDAGVLRFEITDLTTTKVYFVYPDGTAGASVDTIDFTNASPNRVHKTKCVAGGAPQQCTFTLTNLSATAYYAHISSIYKPFELTIKPVATNVEFGGAQVLVDATGKAADVQRRIQVRYSPDQFGGPSYAAQTGAAMCKRFSIDGTSEVRDDSSGHPAGSSACWNSPPYVGSKLLP